MYLRRKYVKNSSDCFLRCNNVVKEIADRDLTFVEIPMTDADWSVISQFALTLNSYEAWGSLEKCAEIANAHRHGSLTELRTCLFFEQRRWHHFGYEP